MTKHILHIFQVRSNNNPSRKAYYILLGDSSLHYSMTGIQEALDDVKFPRNKLGTGFTQEKVHRRLQQRGWILEQHLDLSQK